jgi:cation:H+ antiporter
VIAAGLAIAAGLGLLAVAPDRFVAGSAGLADRWGMSRLLIGAVVIGFGTSTPEMLVSGLAAAGGEPAVGVGNVVGSNMANLALVVPIAALITPLGVTDRLVRGELPLVGVATLGFAVAVQGGLSRVEGGLLAVGLVVALAIVVRRAGRRAPDEEPELGREVGELLADEAAATSWRLGLEALGGLAATTAGAQLLVSGALGVADRLDLSGGFVGLTVVAIGTSLPELVTAVSAARAGEDELVIGNVVGSNMFNALGVGAVVALVGPGPLDDARVTVGAVGLMVVITLAAVLVMARQRTVTRGEALTLLIVYLATLPLLAG